MPDFKDHKELETCFDCPFLVHPHKPGEEYSWPMVKWPDWYLCHLDAHISYDNPEGTSGNLICKKDEIPVRLPGCLTLTASVHEKMAKASVA